MATAKKTTSAKKTTVKKPTGMTVSVIGMDGSSVGEMTLPEVLFGSTVNKALLAQAVRIFLANQREGGAKTKTRGEVEGSTRKIYKQKGTGRARHGGIRAPIFVGGGRAFGPRPHSFALTLSKSMKKVALTSALTAKYSSGDIIVLDGLDQAKGKTKPVASALSHVAPGKTILLVTPEKANDTLRAARNIEGVTVLRSTDVHPYAVVRHTKVVIAKDAIDEMKRKFV